MKKLIPLVVVGLLLFVVGAVQADNLFDEIGDLLKPLVPDELSGAFAVEMRDELRAVDGHMIIMGSYDLVHMFGKPAYIDVWRPKPIGIGASYKFTGRPYRLGIGWDKKLDAVLVYFRLPVAVPF